jgi:two-component system, NarL family, response regulator
MIKVLLVEDDEVFRLGLTISLRHSSDIDLIGEADSIQRALSICNENQPDLILMDIGLPGENGIDGTHLIKQKFQNIKILALTSHEEPAIVEQILAAGADGYCLKGISTERLVHVIQDIHKGVFWIDESISQQIRAYFQKGVVSPIGQKPISKEISKHLTEREQEVLNLISLGKKNLDIAEILCISPGTVRVHVHSILHKLQVKDRTQAALLVMNTPPFQSKD